MTCARSWRVVVIRVCVPPLAISPIITHKYSVCLYVFVRDHTHSRTHTRTHTLTITRTQTLARTQTYVTRKNDEVTNMQLHHKMWMQHVTLGKRSDDVCPWAFIKAWRHTPGCRQQMQTEREREREREKEKHRHRHRHRHQHKHVHRHGHKYRQTDR